MRAFFYFFLLAFVCFGCTKNDPDPGSGSSGGTPPTPVPVSITATPSSIVLLKSGTRQITATIDPATVVDKSMTWTSSNPQVATVSGTGLITAIAAGNAIITVKAVANPSVTTTVSVKVLTHYSVHIVGNGPPATPLASGGLYWINGVEQVLPRGSFANSIAFSLTLSGNDVYVSGGLISSSGWYTAAYWKNGVPVALTNPALEYLHYAKTLTLNGNEVIIPVYFSRFTPCPNCSTEWKASYFRVNGGSPVQVQLNTTTAHTVAYGSAYAAGNVYISGAIQHNNYFRKAVYWKNTMQDSISLTDGQSWAQATAIAVNGSDVYVLGHDGCANFNCKKVIKLWKNDKNHVTIVTDGIESYYPETMIIANNIIYIVGYKETVAGHHTAKLWKVDGNNITDISLTDIDTDSKALGISVSGDDVFVCGYRKENSYRLATYWRLYNNEIVETVTYRNFLYPSHSEATGIGVK
jgi:hypothetical protein